MLNEKNYYIFTSVHLTHLYKLVKRKFYLRYIRVSGEVSHEEILEAIQCCQRIVKDFFQELFEIILHKMVSKNIVAAFICFFPFKFNTKLVEKHIV
jgi:hypothetical protein